MKNEEKNYGRGSPFLEAMNTLKTKIISRGDLAYVNVSKQLEYLELLSKFALGRYLIEHQNFSSHWTDVLMAAAIHKRKDQSDNLVEDFILNHSLLINGWRESFLFFRKFLQEGLKEGIVMASIPCGEMREVLSLDFTNITNFKILGLDIDPGVVDSVKKVCSNSSFMKHITLSQGDAWNLPYHEEIDVIASCGLNIYEIDREKAIDLYREFFRTLKPDGKLIITFLTYPPWSTEISEWDLKKISPEYPILERVLFSDILEIKCRNYRSTSEFKCELNNVGFTNIQVYYDKHHVFPTVIAQKGFVE